MGQRSTLCTQQMLDLQPEQGVSHSPADHSILSGDVADYTNRSIHPGLTASGSTAEQGILSRGFADSTLYGNQYNSFQNFHAIPNLGPSVGVPSNFYAPCMFPSSSSRNFPVPQNNASSVPLPVTPGMDELLRHHQISESIRVFGKRKNGAMPPGNQHNINVPANSSPPSPFLSLNSGFPQWEQSYEQAENHADSTNFEHPHYQDRRSIQTAEGSHRSVRSRSSVISLQPESAYFHHPNYVLQATHLGQPLHPASNLWMAQFGPENNIVDGSCSTWSYNHPMTYLHGRCFHSGGFELTNMAVQAFPDASSSANAAAIFNPTSLPNFHQHLLPVQAMQLPSYAHQVQMQVPSYQHPLNSMHPVIVNPSGHGLNSGSRFPYFPSNSEQLFRPRQIHHTPPDLSDGGVRILSSEGATIISGFYGVGNAIDQHQDMRLDIDEMSYEELLALEEHIGDVKTGLTEEYIINNLKTSVRSSQTASLQLQPDELSRFSQEAETCIICQVAYDDDEIIGTLDCGHNYHGECIKKWLLVKNLCPICKKAGLATDNNSQG